MSKVQSQLVDNLNGKVILQVNEFTLELTDNGYVVTDGWLTDWIGFYEHNEKWFNDGVLDIPNKIKQKLDTIGFETYKIYKESKVS